MYSPQFKSTLKIESLVSEISAFLESHKTQIEKLSLQHKKNNLIKIIYSSLAAGGNSLSEENVKDLVEGKSFEHLTNDILEVENTIKAYERFMDFNPFSCESLLKLYSLIVLGNIDFNIRFRGSSMCILDNKLDIVHVAPYKDLLPALMADLFEWLEKSEENILIKSCLFHYEYEKIHPFEKSNGRTGRFWQARILSEYNEVFAYLPVEDVLYKNKEAFYKSFLLSSDYSDSAYFVEFMLESILKAFRNYINNDNVKDASVENKTSLDNVNNNVKAIEDENDNVNDNVNVKAGDNVKNQENDNVNLENKNNDNVNTTEKDSVNDNVKIQVNDNVKVSDRQKSILEAVEKNPFITQTELSKIIGMTVANINRNMKQLQEMGIIKRIGADKNGSWEVLKTFDV